MDWQSLRDWVMAFNAKGPDGLRDDKVSGAPSKLNAVRQAKLKEIVPAGPDPEVGHVVCRRCLDLQAVIQGEFDTKVWEVTVGRLLHRLGYSHVSTRPRHSGLKTEAIATFKETSRWRSAMP